MYVAYYFLICIFYRRYLYSLDMGHNRPILVEVHEHLFWIYKWMVCNTNYYWNGN